MKTWFYVVTQEMVELGLKGTELTLFAVLNGYSQHGDGCYYGTRRTLAERCGVSSVRTIDAALAALIEKGMIRKVAVVSFGQTLVGFAVCAEFAQGVQNLQGGCAKFAPMKNKIDNKDKSLFIPPTPYEVSAYCKERGWADADGFAAHFCDYYTQAKWHLSNGKPMKDWRKAVITWEPNNKWRKFTTPTPKAPAPKRGGSALEQMLELGQEMGFIENNTPDYEQQ